MEGVPTPPLLVDARLRGLEGRGYLLLVGAANARCGARLEQAEGRLEHAVHEVAPHLHERRPVQFARGVEGLEDARPHGLVPLDHLGLLGDEPREHVLLRGPVDPQHELHGRVLLLREEPLEALANVLGLLTHLGRRVLHHQGRDGAGPAHLVEAGAAGLDHVHGIEFLPEARKPREDLDLVHQPSELRPAIQLDVHAGELHRVSQVVDVSVEVLEAGGPPLVVGQGAGLLGVLMERAQLLLHSPTVELRG
mmetsp:Transcript_8292/g.26325  ORF Transcript_8292/g.26325 Transcript_8292/m.26325 type:complete len:251 (+) Transcript_8292:464-1216(+)